MVRTGLLSVCCALGVLLAARVIYLNRMLFMPPQIEGPAAGEPGASREAAAPVWTACAMTALVLIFLEWLAWLWAPARRLS